MSDEERRRDDIRRAYITGAEAMAKLLGVPWPNSGEPLMVWDAATEHARWVVENLPCPTPETP